MDKRRCNLWIDRALVPVFVGVIWTGFELHVAGHVGNPLLRDHWSVLHTVVSLSFLLLAGIHVHGHWNWYRVPRSVGCGGRRRRVMVLTEVAVLAVATGFLTLFRNAEAGSHLGVFHYLTGLMLTVSALLHILERLRILLGGAKPGGGRSR
ncbi:hypothetical protein [Alistipes sp.]|uniref:hypothetical protein n=1 Tax=Alistipes sp. TaxID=1872444 RepID=UPI003A85118D